jgi:hypothetical protein
VAHAWPHVPQFAASVAVTTHAPLQSVRPLGHAHAPPVHDAVAGHAAHVGPQCASSMVTHAPAERHCPAGQAHVPALQT